MEQSVLPLSDLRLTCFSGSIYLQLPPPPTSPAAWPGCLRSLGRKCSPDFPAGIREGPCTGDPTPPTALQISERKESLNPCSLTSLRHCPRIPSPISLLPGAAPPILTTPPGANPQGKQILPEGQVAQKTWSPAVGALWGPQKSDQHPLPSPPESLLEAGSLLSALLSAAQSLGGLREKVLEKNSHHPAPHKTEGLKQRLLPFIQSPTVPGSPHQPTFPFSPILQTGTVRLRGWGGVGGRHLPSKCWDRDLEISLGMPGAYPQNSMLRRQWGWPSPPCLCPCVPQLHFHLPGARLTSGSDLSSAATPAWMPSSLYTHRHAHTSTLSGSPWERRQESPVAPQTPQPPHWTAPTTTTRLGQTCSVSLPPQTWYRADAL